MTTATPQHLHADDFGSRPLGIAFAVDLVAGTLPTWFSRGCSQARIGIAPQSGQHFAKY
jgi:hypothetical protein